MKHRYKVIYNKFCKANAKQKEQMYNTLMTELSELSELMNLMSENLASGVVDGDV